MLVKISYADPLASLVLQLSPTTGEGIIDLPEELVLRYFYHTEQLNAIVEEVVEALEETNS